MLLRGCLGRNYKADEKFRENNTRYIVILLCWTNERDPPRMDQANGRMFGGRKIFVNVMFHLPLSVVSDWVGVELSSREIKFPPNVFIL